MSPTIRDKGKLIVFSSNIFIVDSTLPQVTVDDSVVYAKPLNISCEGPFRFYLESKIHKLRSLFLELTKQSLKASSHTCTVSDIIEYIQMYIAALHWTNVTLHSS